MKIIDWYPTATNLYDYGVTVDRSWKPVFATPRPQLIEFAAFVVRPLLWIIWYLILLLFGEAVWCRRRMPNLG